MLYTSIAPHPLLAPYIDAYWSVRGAEEGSTVSKILPDGCVDIIFNLGDDAGDMKSGKAYLIGAMTIPIDSPVSPGTRLLGVRFKPAGFSAFYAFSSLHEITDGSVECERSLCVGKMETSAEGLNQFFLSRLSRPKHILFPLLEDIRSHHGQVRVEELAKRHFITVRQMERNFRYHIGISPKEFVNQERFRYTLQRVQCRRPGEGLADIALECGYYDHSHLVHELKRYAGETPGEL
ncbi:MAG TPA: helix-turn-helix transcriptional regulator [Puia sp.]|nr:helix-turn-helix transcriptional regulator [Puia sp.]